jgi:hypothetical protein
MTDLRRAEHNTYPLLMCPAIDILPLLGAFADDFLGGEVEIYGGGGEAIVIAVYRTRWINVLLSTLGLFTIRDTG